MVETGFCLGFELEKRAVAGSDWEGQDQAVLHDE